MFKKIKIGAKLITGFVIVAIIAATIGIIGIVNIKTIDDADTMLYEKLTLPVSYIGTITTYFNRIRVNVVNTTRTKDARLIRSYEDAINKYDKIIREQFEPYKKTYIEDEDKKVFEELMRRYDNYLNKTKLLFELERAGKDKEAAALVNGEMREIGVQVNEQGELVTKYNLAEAKKVADNNTVLANSATRIMIILSVFGFIVSVLLGLFLSRSISKPLIAGVSFAGSIASKDLTKSLDQKILHRGDEVGALANALDVMQKNLISVVTDMGDVASHLAASSEEISASAQNLSAGAQTQAASVEETSASMEELNAAIIQVSGNANDINHKVSELKDTAQESAGLVSNAVLSMDKITESSQQIAEILGLINDIADQTNLLALNAAIEAARAGEHGRGFAVVADEISKLADKSATSAKEIEKLIKQSIKDLTAGTEVVKKAGEAFNKIIGGVNDNSILIDQITKAVAQQSTGANEVQKAIEEINEITQNTSASSEEMAASTEELQSQAENIKSLVDEFQLSGNQSIKALPHTTDDKNKNVTVYKKDDKVSNKK